MNKRRKNYLPSLVLILVLWGLLGGMFFLVEPELVQDIVVPGLYLPFFVLFLPASFFTLALIFNHSRRGLIVAIGLSLYLGLRIYEMANMLNILLIVGMAIAIDRYLDS